MRTRTFLAGVTAALTAVTVLSAPAPALAGTDPASRASSVARAAGTSGTDAATIQKTVGAYWTAERMARAIPADTPDVPVKSEKPAPVPTGPASSVAPAEPGKKPTVIAGRDARPDAGAAAINASPTVGKVFFHNPGDGSDYVCSGSAVNSTSKNVVSTAGHCVYDPDNDNWMDNWVFVPYYDHGARPYGTWYAAQLTTFNGWVDDGDYDWDVAFVNVWRTSGARLVDRVGGNGLAFNYPDDVYVTVVGYPAEDPFDGEWQYYCQGNIYPRWFSDQVGFDCLLTGGASGGPFLYEYNNTSLLGYVNGVVSNGPPETSYSPYFDTDVQNLYNLVAAYTT
ncbi:trypsin-like serine peptidase [Actinoplanes philippinensis]|uniref:trypsin-like serine peptidase n=1 Tax=Actinoplanes philippinensis TaxID=35752 RepID=UPI0033C5AFB2